MAIGNNRPEPDPFKPCSYIPQPGPITRYDPQRASSEYQGFAEPSDSGQGGGGSQIEPSVFGKQAVVEGDDPGASYSTGVNGATRNGKEMSSKAPPPMINGFAGSWKFSLA